MRLNHDSPGIIEHTGLFARLPLYPVRKVKDPSSPCSIILAFTPVGHAQCFGFLHFSQTSRVTDIYSSEYLKRDDQFLAYRTQQEEATNRMVQQARDKDRALAQGVDVNEEDESGAATATQEAFGSKIVVIHPGSQHLRIGLASDALPKTVPMVIARKWPQSEAEEDGGEPLPKRIKIDDELAEEPDKWFGDEFSSQYTTMSNDLKQRMRANKRRVLPNSKELVVNYNRRTPPEVISEHNDPHRVDWTEIPSDAPDYIIGQSALRIPDNSKPRYKLFWPIRYGWFNEQDYTTKNMLYQDVSLIIEHAIISELGLKHKKDWSQYGCVCVIPDLFERNYVTQMLDILLRDLGFGRVCFQQESLSATFGAGYSSSCIVDIGAQKTSVCCVDEGMCIEDSRVNVKYGGADVTETFMRMMLHDYFPYSDINLKRRYDWLLAEELKQKFCTMNESDISVQLYDFHLRAFGEDTRKYFFKSYDETMLAPMVRHATCVRWPLLTCRRGTSSRPFMTIPISSGDVGSSSTAHMTCMTDRQMIPSLLHKPPLSRALHRHSRRLPVPLPQRPSHFRQWLQELLAVLTPSALWHVSMNKKERLARQLPALQARTERALHNHLARLQQQSALLAKEVALVQQASSSTRHLRRSRLRKNATRSCQSQVWTLQLWHQSSMERAVTTAKRAISMEGSW